jgi:4-amino-4-deoxy-L-arabinose transferase-like glycosyltransferase
LSRSWLIFPLLLVYLFNLGAVGFLAPDEPRYASIGREMAASHDFITPRLDHQPWFEKPPLLYWMIALGRAARLPDEWAARLPVALMSLFFLLFFYDALAREFSRRVATAATAILSTSAGWIAYSSAAVNDLPMTAMFSAAMLIALFDTRRERGYLAGAVLGLAILAKAFVPVVLFAPVFLLARRTRLTMIAGCILVAAPWHLLAWARNGGAFWQDYLWKQQILRFFSPSLAHPQPFWYYLPVILAGLFPWTPLAALIFRRKTLDDVRVRFLIVWLLFALIFFSVARNKLPGYALPLLPPLAIVLAVGLDQTGANRKWWIASAALPLILMPVIVQAIPEALLSGLRGTPINWPAMVAGLPFALFGAAAWWLAWRERPNFAIAAIVLGALVGIVYVKVKTLPILDDRVSVRGFWRANSSKVDGACIDDSVRREWRYGLNYYAAREFPDCTGPYPVHIMEYNRRLVLGLAIVE